MTKIFIAIGLMFSLIFAAPVMAIEATDSGETIREKVQEKVNRAMQNPKAYIGTVTDISESTLQIGKFIFNPVEEKAGEILQASIDSETVFVNAKTTAKTVKFSDIAIGDFVIAMGYKNGNSVLTAKRVLIIEAVTTTTKTAYKGIVSEVGKNSLKFKSTDNQELEVVVGKNTRITTTRDGKTVTYDLDEISEGDQIIAAGAMVKDVFEAGRIHVVSNLSVEEIPSPSPSVKASPSPKASVAPKKTP